jgi:hypothetical protein
MNLLRTIVAAGLVRRFDVGLRRRHHRRGRHLALNIGARILGAERTAK